MKKFFITIGPRGTPRLAFEAMAPDAMTAHDRHVGLARFGERVEVTPVPSEADLVRADIERNVDKARKCHEREDACAVEAQAIYFRALGVM